MLDVRVLLPIWSDGDAQVLCIEALLGWPPCEGPGREVKQDHTLAISTHSHLIA